MNRHPGRASDSRSALRTHCIFFDGEGIRD